MRGAAAALLSTLLAGGCGLSGEPVAEPVDDWSFVAEADDVAFRTASGGAFRAVATRAYVQEGRLYLIASTVFGGDDAALAAVLAGEGVRMRAGGRLYDLAARQLTTSAEIDAILPGLVAESGIEATGVRWDPEPERYPGTQIRQWFLRLESATR